VHYCTHTHIHDAPREDAINTVRVPREVVQLLADLRAFLQDRCEPPVYVSDRRLVKAVTLMQVAAYTNGREVVSVYDCLLLQHVLWHRPGERGRVLQWLMGRLSHEQGGQRETHQLQGEPVEGCRRL
jgi:MoxR-like ATPase